MLTETFGQGKEAARATEVGVAPRSSVLWPLLVFTACYVPFLGKAVHLDDPMYLWAARQIQVNPLDFYGFAVNWQLSVEPMASVMKNPPLVSYYLAAVTAVFGWSEVVLHLAMLVPALLVVTGTHRLAQLMSAPPTEAAFLAAISPAFLVSSTTIMCDVLMLSAWVWAVVAWVQGLRRRSELLLAASASLVVAATLTKYLGIALLPLLLAYALLRERRLGTWVIMLGGVVAALAAYELYTRRLYGIGHILEATLYPGEVHQRQQWVFVPKVLTVLAFMGGGFATVGFYAPALWGRKATLIGVLTAAATAVALAAWGSVGSFSLVRGGAPRWGLALQLALFAAVGVSILALCVAELRRARDPGTVLLVLWVLGIMAFAARFNWAVNVRSLLPMAPAVGILVARRLAERAGTGRGLSVVARWAPMVAGGALAFLVAWADATLASAGRDAANSLAAELRGRGRVVWIQGHWGFQYYAELAGMKPIDFKRSVLNPGDLIVVPRSNSNLTPLPGAAIEIEEIREWPVLPFLSTMDPFEGAGFYLDRWGPVPFAFSRLDGEKYAVVRVTARIEP